MLRSVVQLCCEALLCYVLWSNYAVKHCYVTFYGPIML